MSTIDDDAIIMLLTVLHDEKGFDYSQYKEGTLRRRIGARMRRFGVDSVEEYLQKIREDPCELDRLVESLNINVTEFFRNPESFRAIYDIVVPRVVYSKRERHHRIIRAWSCGCASGDEPYSLAIVLLEKLGDARSKFTLSIVGSDIDRDAIREAKEMVYSGDRLRALGGDLVAKYFDDIGGSTFKLKDFAKAFVRFRFHDVVKHPPFLHCDIILCRNLLIYFNKELQEETQLKFYECLNPGGFLVLGMSESLIGSAAELFENVDNRLRIYRRPEIIRDEGGGVDSRDMLSQDDIDRIVKEMLE